MARQTPIAPATLVARDLAPADLAAALAAGWADFRARPGYGLFFASVYVAAGIALAAVLMNRGAVAWLVPAAAGFPLLAPFVAVGLYDVSRRREAGLPLRLRSVLAALRGRGDEQILSMGLILFVAFGFWIIIAHGVAAIFLAETGLAGERLAALATGPGIAMLVVGSSIGAVLALGFYAITVVSLPMLVDRDVDFITAIIVSLAAVRSNPRVLLAWAVLIAVLLFIAMLPMFLGLLVALPVLGHATWHLYRRIVRVA